jgi:hypothetical protein
MKRISLALVLTMSAAFIYADITFSAWGRAVVTPMAFMGEHSAASAATSTWGNTPAVRFTANGIAPSQRIGFNIDLEFSNANAYVVDNAKAWVQPFDWFKLTAGQFNEDDFRGRIGASEFGSWLLPNGGKDEDNLFYRFKANQGAHFKILPLVGVDSPWNDLSIEGAFGSNALGTGVNQLRAILNLLNNEDNDYSSQTSYDESDSASRYNNGDRTMTLLDVYKAIQLGVGYRVPDAGFLRVQFIGNNREVFRYGEQGGSPGVNLERRLVSGLANDRDADTIEAAFLLDALKESQGLVLDIGAKVPLSYTDKTNFIVYDRVIGTDGQDYAQIDNANNKEYTVQRPYVAALGLTWTPAFLTSFAFTARVDASFGGSLESDEDGVKITNGYNVNAWLMPSYGIGNETRLGVDVGIDIHGADTVWKKGVAPAKAQTDASEYFDFGVGPWAELAFSGGRVRLGVVVMVPGSPRYIFNPNSTSYGIVPKFTGDPVISIPISFTYSF